MTTDQTEAAAERCWCRNIPLPGVALLSGTPEPAHTSADPLCWKHTRVPAVDRDIILHVNAMEPKDLAQRVALEQTLQTKRNERSQELADRFEQFEPVGPLADPINHPAHYTGHPSGVECIQITEHMGFNLGNAVKYIWRADEKGNAVEDLEKARWYISRELAKRGAE